MDVTATPAVETIRSAVLTDKGHAVRLLYRLMAVLGVLPDDDRAAVRELLAEELADRTA